MQKSHYKQQKKTRALINSPRGSAQPGSPFAQRNKPRGKTNSSPKEAAAPLGKKGNGDICQMDSEASNPSSLSSLLRREQLLQLLRAQRAKGQRIEQFLFNLRSHTPSSLPVTNSLCFKNENLGVYLPPLLPSPTSQNPR